MEQAAKRGYGNPIILHRHRLGGRLSGIVEVHLILSGAAIPKLLPLEKLSIHTRFQLASRPAM